ncbi:hypothetical protein LJB98_05800 [Bacteroidales bacterium OttesenSCG-928-M11]|nr:hypothetical protein [Bacteroidales bacterium OttesenSCG-928-M11]
MRYLLINILLICNITSFAQSKGDSIYVVKNVGDIRISNKMELQSSSYKPQEPNKVVFQQKGLNNGSISAEETYVRLIIETSIGTRGDYEKLGSTTPISESEMKELNEMLRQSLISQFKGSGMKLITWHGTSFKKINGQNCLIYSYLRQLRDNPPVEVSIYSFHNNDRVHTITISCRKDEKKDWWTILTNSIKSFKITNVR